MKVRRTAAVVTAALSLVGLVMTAGPGSMATAATARPAISMGTQFVYNLNSQLNLEVYRSSTNDGAKVDQWTYNGSATQQWNVVAEFNNAVEIVNANSNKCLEVYNSATKDGAPVDQWTCNGTNTQLWYIEPLTNGYDQVVNRNSNKCLEVYNSATNPGAAVDQWTCNGTNTQLWYGS